MRIEPVEIYSDRTNAVVLRHPGRNFPGLLLQGDTLYSMCQMADCACKAAHGLMPEDEYEELNELRNQLLEFLGHYKHVLVEHGKELPFPAALTPREQSNK